MSDPKKLFLLDAMALIYRAYFAMNKNPRVNSKGLNTSAILGFANTLYDVLKSENPSHIAVCFDSQAPTVRHDDFIQYKAHREAMPEDIESSLPYIIALIDAFNIPVIALEGYEADDIIGTLAKEAESHGYSTYMMTSDKDFGQLVSDKTFIYKPGRFGDKAEVLGIKQVCEKFGIKRPEQIIDMLGLWGDASDNIPGIPGVGEVTARKLLDEFDNLENLLANSSQIKNPKLKLKVEEFKQQAIMSKQLATIILDVPVEFDEEMLKRKLPDENKLRTLFEELEFRAFAKRIFTDHSLTPSETTYEKDVPETNLFSGTEEKPVEILKNNIKSTPHIYNVADDAEKRKHLIDILKKQQSFCFDTETTGLDVHDTELVGMSFCVKPYEAWYVPLSENYNEAAQVVHEFKEILENKNIGKTGQNLKFDISVLKWYDVNVNGKMFDTMLAHYLLQPDMRHGMDVLADVYLNYRTVPIDHLIGKKGKSQLSMRIVPLEEIKEYACEDADITLQLKNVFEPLLTETETHKLFEEIEMPLVPVLAAMEAEGVKIDINVLGDYSIQLHAEIELLTKEIYVLTGAEFNISSPKQLGEILFDKLKIAENARLTKTKQYSTGEDVLQKLVNKHPVVPKILDYRSLTKLKSTYVDSLPLLVNKRTGRIHTSYNQAVAATGRLSSNNPNLQNIPIRTEKGREIRKAFVPRNDKYTLISADYSQIELRILAELSGDNGMKEAFAQGMDIHAATASKINNIPLNEVTKEMRRSAKAVNFGISYGQSAFGLAERLGIPRKEGAAIINQYFTQYPSIKKYMDTTIDFAKKHGYVETIKGRRRYIADINSSNSVVRGYAERNAINAPIQGSAADMIKIAMISIFNEFEKQKLQSKMIMQVHDELVFDVHKDEISAVKQIVESLMKSAIPMKIPIEVEISSGDNWLEAH
ncbi:MAG: DNA polymerase I [Bacteroidota bacterium]